MIQNNVLYKLKIQYENLVTRTMGMRWILKIMTMVDIGKDFFQSFFFKDKELIMN